MGGSEVYRSRIWLKRTQAFENPNQGYGALTLDPRDQPLDPSDPGLWPSISPWTPEALTPDPRISPWTPEALTPDPRISPWTPEALTPDPGSAPGSRVTRSGVGRSAGPGRIHPDGSATGRSMASMGKGVLCGVRRVRHTEGVHHAQLGCVMPRVGASSSGWVHHAQGGCITLRVGASRSDRVHHAQGGCIKLSLGASCPGWVHQAQGGCIKLRVGASCSRWVHKAQGGCIMLRKACAGCVKMRVGASSSGWVHHAQEGLRRVRQDEGGSCWVCYTALNGSHIGDVQSFS